MGIHPQIDLVSNPFELPSLFPSLTLSPTFPYFLLAVGRGLHSSASTGCSMTLMGYCAVLCWYPLLQSYETAYAKMLPDLLNVVATIEPPTVG